MKNKLLIFILFIAFVLTNQSAIAVIAYPYPVEIVQSDGTKLTIILKGDEHVKWAQTLDGYSIMRNSKGVFEYAVIDSNNDMVPSGLKVKNVNERSSSDILFLTNVKKGIGYSKSQVEMMKSISKVYQKGAQKSFPSTGNRKLVCILIGFPDKPFTKTQSDFNNLFNQIGYSTDNATGSVRDYYIENSYGQLDLTVTVAGPYSSQFDMSYYGGNTGGQGSDSNPRALITEAVNLADASLNYADFDNDNDGTVDGVYVIFAGYGEEAGASTDAIWAHAWNISPLTLDGKTVSKYSCSPELRGNNGTFLTRIGVICHEFGHVMGAADYYDTDYSTNGSYDGTGDWDLMASGSWNNYGATPAHHNAYTKIYDYNWASATTLSAGTIVTLDDAESNSNSFYRINTSTPNEFYLIENRQKHKFDYNIPGHGMIIYHADENYMFTAGNRINAGSHQGMYPICANAAGNPPTVYGTINGGNCTFPGTSSITQFTDATTPSMKSWAGLNTYRPITNITENTTNKTITFTFMGNATCSLPTTQATSFTANSVDVNSMTINWTRGDGDGGVLVVAKEGSSIGVDPVNGVAYNANPVFGSGDQVGLGAYAVYSGTGTSVNLSGLKMGVNYYFTIYEFSNSSKCYLTPGLTGEQATPCGSINVFPYSEGFESGLISSCWSEVLDASNLHWRIANGNGYGNPSYPPVSAHSGTNNLVLMNDRANPDVTKLILPVLDISALRNPTLQFWHTQALAGPDQDELRVYYKNSLGGSWVLLKTYTSEIATWTLETLSLPSPSADYYIAFEGTAKWGAGVCIDDILISAGAPETQATEFTSSGITSNSMTIGWTRGSGDNVLVVAKEGSVTSAINPSNGLTYTANSIFLSGGLVGSGNRVVYNGTGNSVTVTGLGAGKTYYFSIYEYTNLSKCYLIPGLTGNVATTSTDINDIKTTGASLLSQNYPNPFDQSTNIDFKIVKPGKVSLIVYNSLGQKIDQIVDEFLFAGSYSYTWNPKGIASGIYFYQLKVDENKEIKRMIKR